MTGVYTLVMANTETPTTFDDLTNLIGRYLPGASFDRDDNGQIVIYTNLFANEEGELSTLDESANRPED